MKVYGITPQVTGYNSSKVVPRSAPASKTFNMCTFIKPVEPQPLGKPPVNPYPINSGYLNAQSINFGYSSILKDLFKEGKMPSVTQGLYGNKIDSKTVSLEHLKAKSDGGKSVLSNFALAHKDANNLRGNKPLCQFLSKEMLEEYLSQFNFEIPEFNGFTYQDMIRSTCRKLGVGSVKSLENGLLIPDKKIITIDYGNMKDVLEHLDDIDVSQLSKKMLRSLRNRGYLQR